MHASTFAAANGAFAPSTSSAAGARALLVADAGAPDIAALIAHARAQVLLVQPGQAALELITTALAGGQVDTLHIVAHGSAGCLTLGGRVIDSAALLSAAPLLAHWQVATIALWSCAAGRGGKLPATLSALTGAAVSATAHPLGMVGGAPRWDLELGAGAVPAPFAAPLMQNWPHTLAKLSFANAYAIVTSASDAAKEANSATFSTTSLSTARIDDLTGGQNFSGNDVVVELDIGGTIYYGWISRPIKAGGVVRGFYFWSDPQFTSLSAATTDGNADGDGDSSDNFGFVIVIDQAWFDALASSAGGTLKTVGTSSDRVDSALNALLSVNSAPTPVNDSVNFVEDAGAQSGNVLTNDTDANSDSLAVTGFSVGGSAGSIGVSKTIAGVGSFLIQANGSYTFTPVANYAGTVPLISYAVADGRGGSGSASLSISVTPVNDAPAGADKTIGAREGTAYTFSAADFGFSDSADTVPNALLSVKISTLPDPAKGTLTLNGAPVAAGDFIAAASITSLKFVPAANGSGANYASFTFQVRDNGGGAADTDATPNTITFDVSNVNSAPSASADAASATEAGGAANATPGVNPSANLLANDSDPDSGDSMSVVSASGSATATTAVGASTAINGSYGTLVLSSDGNYTYTVNNSNAAVQALASNADTLADTFSYTVKDGAGLPSTSSLTVTVHGANDNPEPASDFDFAIASTVAEARLNPAGNVLANDRDVDSGDSLTVSRASSGATLAGTIVTIGAGASVTGGEGRTYESFSTQGAGNIGGVGAAVSGTGVPAGTTVASVVNNSGTKTITFANAFGNVAALDGVASITINGNSFTIDLLGTASASIIAISGASGTISSGMAVTGTGIQAATTVSSVGASGGISFVTLSKTVSGALGTDVAFGSSGTSITGSHGTLLLQQDGTYTYTVTDATPSAGTDTFTYELQDSAGAASTAQLTVQIVASNVAPPTAVADTVSIAENTAATAGADNVLDNDSQSAGAKAVVDARSGTGAMTAATVGGTAIGGQYGSLNIKQDGSYTYTVDNGNGAVDALASGQSLNETFTYRMGDATVGYAVSTLTVTINGANDAPVAVADSATAREAGAYANDAPGFNPAGNVLANDTDPDGGDAATVAFGGTASAGTAVPGGTTSSDGLAVTGSYGTLTLGADGSYVYAVDNGNATVQALGENSAGLTDTFHYKVRDASGALSETTVDITVLGANDAPVNTTGAPPVIAEGASGAIAGISVADVDDASLTVQLSVASGTLDVSNLNGCTISAGANGSATLTLSGATANLNLALGALSYQGTAQFSGTDTLAIVSTDAGGLATTSTLDITVTPDNRALTVSAPTVNEASDYAVFSVTGASGQKVTLAAGTTGSGVGHAASGADFVPALEYFDGASWHAYDGNAVAIPAGNVLFVRTAILGDTLDEGPETFSLSATNKAGAVTTNTGTIVDDGTGLVYDGAISGGAPTSSASGLDDDRALAVTSVNVNEASPYAAFTLTGVAGQVATLAIVNGSAGAADHGAAIEYYDGAAWQAYSGSLTLPAGGSVYLRTAITQDGVYEGPESFAIVASNLSGRAFVGNALITDDGTGTVYPGTVTGGALDANTDDLDNDMSLAISAYGPVNEGSAYAMFKVAATVGEVLNLAIAGSGGSPAATAGFAIEFSTDGSSWTVYDSSTQPLVPAGGNVYVRVDISSEQDSQVEGAEGLSLSASIGTGAGKTATAGTSIVDDGTGSKYDGTVAAGVPVASTSGLDHDTGADTTPPTIAVASNAASLAIGQTATITFTLSEASVNFTAADVTASGGTLSGFGGSGASYSATFTPAANSTTAGVVSVASSAFTDAAGNANSDGADANNAVSMTVNTVAADTTPPTIAVASNTAGLTSGQTATITFTLSEASSNFTTADVAVSGGALSGFGGSGASYSATFTPAANSTTAGVVSIASNTFTDAAGNANNDGADANNAVSMTVNTLAADTTPPTIAIQTDQNQLTPGHSATITFTLSEAATNFNAGDVVVSGGTLSNFSGSGTAYSAVFTAGSTGNGSVSVASARFTDAAGNANATGASASLTIAYPSAPSTPPLVTITEDANNDGRLVADELQGDVGVAIGLPAGALAGQVLKVSSGGIEHAFVLTGQMIAAGIINTSFAAPAKGAAIAVSAHIVDANGQSGPSGSDTAARVSSVPFAITGISEDTGIAGDFITSDSTLVVSGTAETGTVVSVMLDGVVIGTVVASADKWSYDASAHPLANGSHSITASASDTGGPPASIVVQIFSAALDPASDNGISTSDQRTSITTPEFVLSSTGIMASGDTARLVDASGAVVGASLVTAAEVAAGKVNVLTEELDDGTYIFTAQILDGAGQVKVEGPVNVTIVTDLDGVMPSVERTANNGDFNGDGIADSQQNNLAQLPLSSLDAFRAGIHAPAASFGAIMDGDLHAANPAAAVALDPGAQLLGVGLAELPAALPANIQAATPMLAFSITGVDGKALVDVAPGVAGLQTRVVIDLPAGVLANSFMKWNADTRQWYNFLDDQRLDTYDNGATLLDTNGDGKIDRVVVTLTDGGPGDEDGAVNGTIVDPGLLAFQAANPVYSVLLAGGDRYYTSSAAEAAKYAAGAGNVFEGARFDSLSAETGGHQLYANYQPYTHDWYFGAAQQANPYACYDRVSASSGFFAAGAAQGIGEQFHLYLDARGLSQLVTQAEAATLGLAGAGYADKGAQFSTTTNSAFSFDAEGFLVANANDAGVQALVHTLASSYQHSSEAGFIEAVEHYYLTQVELVGINHGGAATAAELNAAFSTAFLA